MPPIKTKITKAVHSTPFLEHVGFAVLAAAEVIGAHPVIWWVCLWLMITGFGACVVEFFGGH